jgi:hypothetical protein
MAPLRDRAQSQANDIALSWRFKIRLIDNQPRESKAWAGK